MISEKLKELYLKAGFSVGGMEDTWPTYIQISDPLRRLVLTVIEECATVAENHSRSYSDGETGAGSIGAANAVRSFGKSVVKID